MLAVIFLSEAFNSVYSSEEYLNWIYEAYVEIYVKDMHLIIIVKVNNIDNIYFLDLKTVLHISTVKYIYFSFAIMLKIVYDVL